MGNEKTKRFTIVQTVRRRLPFEVRFMGEKILCKCDSRKDAGYIATALEKNFTA